MNERWVDADSYEAGAADARTWESHLRAEVAELRRENERLRRYVEALAEALMRQGFANTATLIRNDLKRDYS